jgi:hypothetical protein
MPLPIDAPLAMIAYLTCGIAGGLAAVDLGRLWKTSPNLARIVL